MAEGKTQMSAGDRVKLFEAVRTARSTTASKDQIKAAGQVQRQLKDKYPDIYGAARREAFNMVESGASNMSKGGKATKKVPVISIGVGMAEVKKGNKPAMAYGGMSGGKKHMYAAGGNVTDNAGLRALKKASPEAYKNITGMMGGGYAKKK
jgi:hypothetical protein